MTLPFYCTLDHPLIHDLQKQHQIILISDQYQNSSLPQMIITGNLTDYLHHLPTRFLLIRSIPDQSIRGLISLLEHLSNQYQTKCLSLVSKNNSSHEYTPGILEYWNQYYTKYLTVSINSTIINLAVPSETTRAFSDIALNLYLTLRKQQFSITLNSQIVPQAINILFLPHHPMWRNAPSNSILLNLEQLSDTHIIMNQQLLDFMRQYTVWDYSLPNINYLKQHNISAHHLRLGYHYELEQVIPLHKDIDVLFYGGINQKRQEILTQLTDRGFKVFASAQLDLDDRNQMIARSKIILNIHYYDACIFEYYRILFLLNNKAFVITEDSIDLSDYQEITDGLIVSSRDQIPATVEKYLNDPSGRQQIADKGYQLLKKFQPKVPPNNWNQSPIPWSIFDYHTYIKLNPECNPATAIWDYIKKL